MLPPRPPLPPRAASPSQAHHTEVLRDCISELARRNGQPAFEHLSARGYQLFARPTRTCSRQRTGSPAGRQCGHQNGNPTPPYRRLLRFIVSIIFTVLFVAALDVFLVSIACIPQALQPPRNLARVPSRCAPAHPSARGVGKRSGMRGKSWAGALSLELSLGAAGLPQAPHSTTCVLYNFPQVRFNSMPQLVHGTIGIIMCVLSIFIGYLVTVGDSEQNMFSDELMASADSLAKMRNFICCTLLTVLSNFLIEYMKLLSVVLLVLFAFMHLAHLRSVPFYFEFANYLESVTGEPLLFTQPHAWPDHSHRCPRGFPEHGSAPMPLDFAVHR